MIRNFTRFLMVGLFLCGIGFKGHAATLVEAVDEAVQISKATFCQWKDETELFKNEYLAVKEMSNAEIITFFERKWERKIIPSDGGASKIRKKFMEKYERVQEMQQGTRKGKEGDYSCGILDKIFDSLREESFQPEQAQMTLNQFFYGQTESFLKKIEVRSRDGIYPSTIPGNFRMADIAYNQENSWKTRTRWFNEMATLKLLMPFIEPHVREEILTPMKGHEKYGGFFITLEAYLLDLVETPPLPDHWEYQGMVTSKRTTEEALERIKEMQSQLKSSGGRAIQGQSFVDGRVVKEDFTMAKLKSRLLNSARAKENSEKWLQDFAFLKEQEDAAVEALKQHASGALQPGQWRAEREAEERATAKRKKAASRKKASAAKKKAAARLEKEQIEAEEAAEIEAVRLVAAQAEAERLKKEHLEAEARAAQEEVVRLEAQMAFERKEAAERERATAEVDAVAIAEAMEEHRIQVEKDRRAKKARAKEGAPRAAAREEEEAGPAFPVIRLKDKSHHLMQEFWTAPTMKWIDFRNLFASDEMGFSLTPSGGSIRKFVRDAADGVPKILFVVHEPHESYQSDSFGPSTLGHLRELLTRQAGWTLKSFVRGSK
jgi:hypothetical protein